MKHALIAFFFFPVLLIAQPRYKWTQIEAAPGQGYLVSSQGVNGSWEDSLRFYGGLMRITGGLTMSDVTALTGDSMLVWRGDRVYRRGFRQALSAYNAVSGTGLESSIPVWATDSTLGFSTWYIVSNQVGYNNLSPVYQFDMRSSTNSALGLPNVATASLPTGYSGGLLYNTTAGNLGFYGAAAWEYPVKSSTGTGLGTANYVFVADANGRATNRMLFDEGSAGVAGVGTPTNGLATNTVGYMYAGGSTVSQSSTSGTGSLIISNETTTGTETANILFGSYSGGLLYRRAAIGSGGINATGSGYLFFSTRNSAGTWGEAMRIDNQQRVGIGTTSPAYILDVNGTGAMRPPSGTTAQRPTGANYLIRGNSTTAKLETYYSSAWKNIATEDWITQANLGWVDGTGTAGYMMRWSDSNTATNAPMYTDGTDFVTGAATVGNIASTLKGLEIIRESSHAALVLGAFNSTDSGSRNAGIIMARARNTSASPAAVQNLDRVGFFLATGYDGTNWQNSAGINFYVNGTVSAGTVPIRMDFATGTSGAGRTERLTIDSDGDIGIGTTSPSYILDISSTGAIRPPSGTTAQRPTAADYLLRGNTTNTKLETYYSAAWHNIATETWVTANYATPAAITWTLAGDTGTPQAVTSTQTATWAGGWGINTSVGGTRTVTVEVDSSQVATQYDLSQVAQDNIYTADGTISEERTVTTDGYDLNFLFTNYGTLFMNAAEGDFSGTIGLNEFGPYIRSTRTGSSPNFSQIYTFNDPPEIVHQVGRASPPGYRFITFLQDTIVGYLMHNNADTIYRFAPNGSFRLHQYGSNAFTSTHPKNAMFADGSGNMGEKRWVRPAYTSDADLTISADTLAVALEHRVYMEVTSGASSATEVTIPDAGATYLHTSIAFTCKDDSGSYACIVNANTATIMDPGIGTDVSTYTISPYKTVVFRVMQTGASTYRWTIQD